MEEKKTIGETSEKHDFFITPLLVVVVVVAPILPG